MVKVQDNPPVGETPAKSQRGLQGCNSPHYPLLDWIFSKPGTVILIKQSVEPNQKAMKLAEISSPIRILQFHIPPCDIDSLNLAECHYHCRRYVQELNFRVQQLCHMFSSPGLVQNPLQRAIFILRNYSGILHDHVYIAVFLSHEIHQFFSLVGSCLAMSCICYVLYLIHEKLLILQILQIVEYFGYKHRLFSVFFSTMVQLIAISGISSPIDYVDPFAEVFLNQEESISRIALRDCIPDGIWIFFVLVVENSPEDAVGDVNVCNQNEYLCPACVFLLADSCLWFLLGLFLLSADLRDAGYSFKTVNIKEFQNLKTFISMIRYNKCKKEGHLKRRDNREGNLPEISTSCINLPSPGSASILVLLKIYLLKLCYHPDAKIFFYLMRYFCILLIPPSDSHLGSLIGLFCWNLLCPFSPSSILCSIPRSLTLSSSVTPLQKPNPKTRTHLISIFFCPHSKFCSPFSIYQAQLIVTTHSHQLLALSQSRHITEVPHQIGEKQRQSTQKKQSHLLSHSILLTPPFSLSSTSPYLSLCLLNLTARRAPINIVSSSGMLQSLLIILSYHCYVSVLLSPSDCLILFLFSVLSQNHPCRQNQNEKKNKRWHEATELIKFSSLISLFIWIKESVQVRRIGHISSAAGVLKLGIDRRRKISY
ncbi:hypothetical protein VP01_4001g2 [Puccinia sorghi]|uniref:Uncharacterized protein n=1 Tax=Puccinia sorghi TaxID=27349 RepID=A0A0L6US14_9BASI|nr:hypothetical protein VP01_4001g2 [Puccinia sorghi]